ncbi:MAG: energy transducer TonB [Novosphingobium sp.]
MDLGTNKRQRIPTLLAVSFLHVLVIYALIAAFGVVLPLQRTLNEEFISTFVHKTIPPPPPPPRPAKHAGGALPKPAGKKAQAAPVLAVPLVVVVPVPMVAASSPALGTANRNGAAEAGAGNGGGGSGNGTGTGAGNGAGGGTEFRLLSGAIRESDYPREAVQAHQSGKVHIRFTVGINGRATNCVVTRSSGSPSLDEATCRLIMQRFRYEPSRDASGRPYADVEEGIHEWRLAGAPAEKNGATGADDNE